MSITLRWLAFTFLASLGLIPVEAATVSPRTADEFDEKLTLILSRGDSPDAGTRRTPVSQDEVNSWLLYRSQPLLPEAVGQPQVTIVGEGQMAGQAVVDLDAVATPRSTGGLFNPLRLLGGKVPIRVTGILHARDGMARFEVQTAAMSGISVPVAVLQQLVSYFSRTPERPQGARLDDTFVLPAGIQQIEVGAGHAVVVQ